MRMISRVLARWRRSGWKEFVFALIGVTVLFCVWGFAELVDDVVQDDEYRDLEQTIMRSLRQTDDPSQLIGPWWLLEVARDVSALGSAVVLILMVVFVLGYLLQRRGYAGAALVLIATLGGYILSAGMKSWFGRPRPDVVPHLTHISSGSFPSGHSMLSSVVYLTLGALLAQSAARKWEKVYLVHVALFLSFIVGLSRVALGVHYPSDVLAGWGAGTAWALICWSVAYWLQSRGTLKQTPEAAAVSKEEAAAPERSDHS